jgi:hypothetical protein
VLCQFFILPMNRCCGSGTAWIRYALIDVSCIGTGNGYPDPNLGQILTTEIEKDEEILCYELLVVLF